MSAERCSQGADCPPGRDAGPEGAADVTPDSLNGRRNPGQRSALRSESATAEVLVEGAKTVSRSLMDIAEATWAVRRVRVEPTPRAEAFRLIRPSISACQAEQPVAPGFKRLLLATYCPPTEPALDLEHEARVRELRQLAVDADLEWEARQVHRAACRHCAGKDAIPFALLERTCPTKGANT